MGVAAAVSLVDRTSLRRPDARHDGQMLDLFSKYLCRFALRGTSASSVAVYSSMVNPHCEQQSLIFSIDILSNCKLNAGLRVASDTCLSFPVPVASPLLLKDQLKLSRSEPVFPATTFFRLRIISD